MYLRPLLFFLFLVLSLVKLPTAMGEVNKCEGWLTNLRSPLCTDAKYIFWTGTLLTAGLYYTRDRAGDRIRVSTLADKPLGHDWAKIGDYMGMGWLNGGYILGQALFGGKGKWKNAEHMFEASGYSAFSMIIMKKYISEGRPGAPDQKDSFPSGHSTMSFAFASVVGARHNIFAGTLAYLTAGYIAYTRVHDDYHHFHDVVFGATLGISYGLGIYYNHKDSGKPYWLGFLPTEDLQGMQMAYSYRF